MTASHQGRDAGRFNARSKPVTTALKSSMLFFLCTILLKIHSEATQLAIVTKIKINALNQSYKYQTNWLAVMQ